MKQLITFNESNEQPKKGVIEVQPREEKFGPGENQRVIEIEWAPDFKVGVNCGDIAQAPTTAVMCPTTPWLQLGGGAVEWAIADAAGSDLFEVYAAQLMELLRRARSADATSETDLAIINTLMQQLNISLITGSPLEMIEQAKQLTTIGEHGLSVAHGASVAAPSYNLKARGIDTVVLTNVTPEGRSMTVEDMSKFTMSALLAASNRAGNTSVTVPAIGTGFAAALGFGLSYEDSLKGLLAGVEGFLKLRSETGLAKGIDRLDYNIYCGANLKNATQIAEMFSKVGNFEFTTRSGGLKYIPSGQEG